MLKHNTVTNDFNRLPAVTKLLIAVAFAAIVFLLLLLGPMEWVTRLMISWDVFSTCLLVMSGVTFFTMKPRQIRLLAKSQDASRALVFVIILAGTVCSLLGILILLLNKGNWILNKYLVTIIYIFGVNSSWLLLHTIFTYRYAHLYYENQQSVPTVLTTGLDIPEELSPDYLDFAYFSFVIGMTFQVSDVRITSREIRRLALLHGMLSFLFNTVIVALSINVIIDLKG
ncbi:MAG TPA: DUF1345 domain-containing protein [Puia sp.]|nr:DUF1345 domain-containing protein [Puia sp.]